jgi:hypothetical protein
VPVLTGVMQSISMLLKLDAGIRAIAEQCRIAGVVRDCVGVQLRGSHEVAGFFSGKAVGGLAGNRCGWICRAYI